MTKKKGTAKKTRKASSQMTVLNPNAAGIDLGSREHYVAVPADRCDTFVQSFGVYTTELQKMAQWLKECRISTVAMEATGVYWLPVFTVLEEAGFKVVLVDARKTKNVSGRKTDVVDAEWIRQLHTFGLLSPAFVPPVEIRAIRAVWRHREGLVAQAARQIHLMQKSLDLMNLHLHKVLSDVAGVSGMSILRAIIAGEHDPNRLVTYLQKGIKATKQEVKAALTGHYREEYLFCLKQAVETYDYFQEQMKVTDQQLQTQLRRLAPPEASHAKKKTSGKSPSRRKNQPHFDLAAELERTFGVDLTAIEGIEALTAQTILSELGGDLSSFPSGKHFASWAGLSPNNRITGGKVKSRRTRKVANPVATALRRAAQSLHHSKSALGAFLRRMKAKKGMPKAITATARKLAMRVYDMICHGLEYVQQGADEYEEQFLKRKRAHFKRSAQELGFGLIELETGEVVA